MASHTAQVRTIGDLRGAAGRLEALLNTGLPTASMCALVCHPHPAGGGTMHNKVVYHAMKAIAAFGLPVLRFNFRGVGLSEGEFAGGVGEQDDVRIALDWLHRNTGLPILFAGFSFGCHVGLRACCGDPRVAGLIALGLPIEAEGRRYAYEFLPQCTASKLFLTGSDDPYAPRFVQQRVIETAPDPKRASWIEGADHFFQGTPASPESKLPVMRAEVSSWVADTFALRQHSF